MRRIEANYAGYVRFIYIDTDHLNANTRSWLKRTSSDSRLNIPMFGFFNSQGTRVNRLTGWNEQSFINQVEALVN